MPTTHVEQYERALDSTWRTGELPALTTVDRVALRLGLVLILWGQRHAERADRRDESRRSTEAARSEVAAAARDAFERRVFSGPTW